LQGLTHQKKNGYNRLRILQYLPVIILQLVTKQTG